MRFTIYNKGQEIVAEVKDIDFSTTYMGDKFINAKVETPFPIAFTPFDWIVFRNERFYLIDLPSDKKQGKTGYLYNSFVYDLSLKHISYELQNCDFLDIVPSDNNLHYTGFPMVNSFMDINALCGRIQANLDRIYTGANKWTIEIKEGLESEAKAISLSDSTCWNALMMLKSEFDCLFYIDDRTIYVGGHRGALDHTFMYGAGNGLFEIERISTEIENVVTRVRAYGGNRNIPRDYKKGEGSKLPDAQYIPSLMLPDYETTGIDYIDSENIKIYGIREGIFRDENIFPSIEGVTADDLKKAGYDVSSQGRIDEIVQAEVISNDEQATFNVWIKDIGFNIKDYLTTDDAVLAMKNGACGGVEFEIAQVVEDTSVEGAKYKLTLNRHQDETFVLPNKITKVNAGDRFVLLEITMPELYIKTAEQRLKDACEKWLSQNSSAKVTYSIGVSEIFMANNPDIGEEINEGNTLHVIDKDLGIDRNILIQTLNITFNKDSSIGKYDIVLSDEPTISDFNKVQNDIEKVKDEFISSKNESDKNIRKNIKTLNALKDKLFDTDGYFDNTNLKPNSIETMYLSVGAKSSNFTLLCNILPNYEGNPNAIAFTEGQLIHREIYHGSNENIDANYVWNMPNMILKDLDATKSYYIYAKCNVNNNVAEWELSDKMIRYTDNTNNGWYYFKAGVLFDVVDGVRSESFDYGKTWINGRFISTGVIQSLLGLSGSFFDLDNNKFRAGSVDDGMDWNVTEENTLTIKGMINAISAKLGGFVIDNNKFVSTQQSSLNLYYDSARLSFNEGYDSLDRTVNTENDKLRYKHTNRLSIGDKDKLIRVYSLSKSRNVSPIVFYNNEGVRISEVENANEGSILDVEIPELAAYFVLNIDINIGFLLETHGELRNVIELNGNDGSGNLGGNAIEWNRDKNLIIRGLFESNSSGDKIIIDPINRKISFTNRNGIESSSWSFDNVYGGARLQFDNEISKSILTASGLRFFYRNLLTPTHSLTDLEFNFGVELDESKKMKKGVRFMRNTGNDTIKIRINNLPTSPNGLEKGELYRSGNSINIV